MMHLGAQAQRESMGFIVYIWGSKRFPYNQVGPKHAQLYTGKRTLLGSRVPERDSCGIRAYYEGLGFGV